MKKKRTITINEYLLVFVNVKVCVMDLYIRRWKLTRICPDRSVWCAAISIAAVILSLSLFFSRLGRSRQSLNSWIMIFVTKHYIIIDMMVCCSTVHKHTTVMWAFLIFVLYRVLLLLLCFSALSFSLPFSSSSYFPLVVSFCFPSFSVLYSPVVVVFVVVNISKASMYTNYSSNYFIKCMKKKKCKSRWHCVVYVYLMWAVCAYVDWQF